MTDALCSRHRQRTSEYRRVGHFHLNQMAAEVKKEIELEIAHVLFLDLVGYSKLSVNEQHAQVEELNEIVRLCEQFRKAEAASRLLKIPTGDGMALVFYKSPEEPAQCAVEISRALKDNARLQVRMGIHSGPVSGVVDVTERTNVAGAGVNMAKRVMDCGDAGHILLSHHVAEDLAEYERWRPFLHDIGTFEVKHGVPLSVTSLYSEEIGNPQLPSKLHAVRKRRALVRLAKIGVALLLLGAIITAFVFLLHRSTRAPLAILDKSIAVLPFENRSEDKANAYFADGIQDEILTRLSKIADLKVISRTSTQHYKSAPKNLPEVARQLGVAHILEGSVQRSGDTVRVNVQLIKAANDSHLWADTFDRKMTDIFSVESEVAKAIADKLRAKLTGQEEQVIAAKPTDNVEAYDAYLRAREYQNRPTSLQEDYEMAERLYTQAVSLDPSFALAHARLSTTLAYIFLNFQPTAAVKTRARAEANVSLRLQPDLGEGHLARALCLYWTERAYDDALHELEIAGNLLPNDADIPFFTVGILRRQGRWNEAMASMEQALSRDPRNALFMSELANTECMLRRWSAAARAAGRAAALASDLPTLRIEKSYIDFWLSGDLAPLRATLAEIPESVDPDGVATRTRWDAALLARDFGAAEHAVVVSVVDKVLILGNPVPKSYMLGCVALAKGEPARAQALFEAARPAMEAAVLAAPMEPFRHAWLGLLYAYLGRKEDALREGRRAVTLLPESKDAVYGPTLAGMLALTYARTGESAQALTLIERLLTTPGAVAKAFEANITLADLRLRWQWDPLRSDPRFQKIVAGSEPRTTF
jgi:TolB-like protein/class 3 adenylate cyclase